MEFLELKALKILKKTMLSIISESELKIKKIENILDTYSKCYLCKEPYKENELRPIEKKELDKFKTYDEENYDNDSCYDGLQEDELYCEPCIKNRYDDLRLYNSINQDHTDLM